MDHHQRAYVCVYILCSGVVVFLQNGGRVQREKTVDGRRRKETKGDKIGSSWFWIWIEDGDSRIDKAEHAARTSLALETGRSTLSVVSDRL